MTPAAPSIWGRQRLLRRKEQLILTQLPPDGRLQSRYPYLFELSWHRASCSVRMSMRSRRTCYVPTAGGLIPAEGATALVTFSGEPPLVTACRYRRVTRVARIGYARM